MTIDFDRIGSDTHIEAAQAKPFDMMRISTIIGELDPQNQLGLSGDNISVAKLWGAFFSADDPEFSVTNVVRTLQADRHTTIEQILESLAAQKKQK